LSQDVVQFVFCHFLRSTVNASCVLAIVEMFVSLSVFLFVHLTFECYQSGAS